MNILHVTDLHFNKPWFDWLLRSAPPRDLLVISGNLLDRAGDTPLRAQIDWVSGWLKDLPGPLCVCSGAHDLEWDPRNRRWTPAYWLRDLAGPLVCTDGGRLALDGLSFLSIGCTTLPKGAGADVWISHVPPAKTRVAAHEDGDGGDPDLAASLRRLSPRLVLSGCVHAPARWFHLEDGTLCLNPGRDPLAPRPNHIVVRTERMTCEFVGSRSDAPRVADLPYPLAAALIPAA